MTETAHNQLVADLARKTLEQIKPGSKDLELFDIYSEEYFRLPQQALAGMEVKNRPLGSGFGIGEIILVPILLWLGGKIADKVTDKLLDRGLHLMVSGLSQDESANPALRLIKRLLQKFGFGKTVKSTPAELAILPPLTIAEKQALRAETLVDPEVKALVSRYQLSETLIVSLVDAMVANLPINPN